MARKKKNTTEATTANTKKAGKTSGTDSGFIGSFEKRHGLSVSYSPDANEIALTPSAGAVYGNPDSSNMLLIINAELFALGVHFSPHIRDDASMPDGDVFDSQGNITEDWQRLISGDGAGACVTARDIRSGNYSIAALLRDVEPDTYKNFYFNGKPGQFPKIAVPDTYEQYQYVADLDVSTGFVWPERKLTIELKNLNFLVDVSVDGIDASDAGRYIRDNANRMNQIIEIDVPPKFDADGLPVMKLDVQAKVKNNPIDLTNAYKLAYQNPPADSSVWGGRMWLEADFESNQWDGSTYVLTDWNISSRNRGEVNGDDDGLICDDDIQIFNRNNSNIMHIDDITEDMRLTFDYDRRNYTKRFIIMTDGNVIVTDHTQLNDYIHVYDASTMYEMNTPDPLVIGYKNTIGQAATNPEWPWNMSLMVRPSIKEEYDKINCAALGCFDSSHVKYDQYIEYKNSIRDSFAWDNASDEPDSSHGDPSTVTLDGIACTAKYVDGNSIQYDISVENPSEWGWHQGIYYLAFEARPVFKSVSVRIFIGYDPDIFVVSAKSGEPFKKTNFIMHVNGMYVYRYQTVRSAMNEKGQLSFNVTNNGLELTKFSDIYISDNMNGNVTREALPAKNTTKYDIPFVGKLYDNMSIYIRPLACIKIYFRCYDQTQVDAFNKKYFTVSVYDGFIYRVVEPEQQETEDLEFATFNLTSEMLPFRFRITRTPEKGGQTDYTFNKPTIEYGTQIWKPVPANGKRYLDVGEYSDYVIEQFDTIDPQIDGVNVNIELRETFSLRARFLIDNAVYIDANKWSADNVLKLRLDKVISSIDGDTEETTETPVLSEYKYNDVTASEIDGIKSTDSSEDARFEADDSYATFYIRSIKGRQYEVETYSAGQVPLHFAFSPEVPAAGNAYAYIQIFDAGGSIRYTPTEDGYLCYSALKADAHDFKCTEFADSNDETYEGTAVRSLDYTFTKATFNHGHSDIQFDSAQGAQCYGIEYKSYDNGKSKTEIERMTDDHFARIPHSGTFVGNVDYYINKSMKFPVYYGLDVKVLKFNALNINFTYECEQNRLLKATLYNPTVWPSGIDTGWSKTTKTLNLSGTVSFTTNDTFPIPCIRIEQNIQSGVHFYCKLAVTLTVTKKDGTTVGYTLNHEFVAANKYCDIYPEKFNDVSVFLAQENLNISKIDVHCKLEPAYRVKLKITKVKYLLPAQTTLWRTVQAASGQDNVVLYEDGMPESEISRIPGENPRNVNSNIEVYVRCLNTVDGHDIPLQNNRTIILSMVDQNNQSGQQLTHLYPDQPELNTGTGEHKFTLTSSQDAWNEETSLHKKYSGDSVYGMKVTFEDRSYEGSTGGVLVIPFKIQPIFRLYFEKSQTGTIYPFDSYGYSLIRFRYHVMGEQTTRSGYNRGTQNQDYVVDFNHIGVSGTDIKAESDDGNTSAGKVSFSCDGISRKDSPQESEYYQIDAQIGEDAPQQMSPITITATVADRTAECQLKRVATTKIYYYDGDQYMGDSTWLPPVPVDSEKYALYIDIKKEPAIVSVSNITITDKAIASVESECFDVSYVANPEAGVDYRVGLKVTKSLYEMNEEHGSQTGYSKFYTNQERELTLQITYSDGQTSGLLYEQPFTAKVGAVIFMEVDNLGEETYMKPEPGTTHDGMTARAYEYCYYGGYVQKDEKRIDADGASASGTSYTTLWSFTDESQPKTFSQYFETPVTPGRGEAKHGIYENKLKDSIPTITNGLLTVALTPQSSSQSVKNWYTEKSYSLSVSEISVVGVYGSVTYDHQLTADDFDDMIKVWTQADGGNIKIPAKVGENGQWTYTIIAINAPRYKNMSTNPVFQESKIHIRPGDVNIYKTGDNNETRFIYENTGGQELAKYTQSISGECSWATHYIAVKTRYFDEYDMGYPDYYNSEEKRKERSYYLSRFEPDQSLQNVYPYNIKIVTNPTTRVLFDGTLYTPTTGEDHEMSGKFMDTTGRVVDSADNHEIVYFTVPDVSKESERIEYSFKFTIKPDSPSNVGGTIAIFDSSAQIATGNQGTLINAGRYTNTGTSDITINLGPYSFESGKCIAISKQLLKLDIEVSTGVHPDSQFKDFKFEFVNWMEMTFSSNYASEMFVPVLNIKEGSVTTARLFHTEIRNAVKWYNGNTKNKPDYAMPVEPISMSEIEIVDVPDDFKNNIEISVGDYHSYNYTRPGGSDTRKRYYVDISLRVKSGDLNPAEVGAYFKLKVRNRYGYYRYENVYLQYSYLREAYVYNIDSSASDKYEKFYSYTYDVSVDGTVVTRNREEMWPENFYLPCAYFGKTYYDPSDGITRSKEPDFKFVYRSYPWRKDETIIPEFDYIKENVTDVSIMYVADNDRSFERVFNSSILPQSETDEEMEMIDYVDGTILYLRQEGESSHTNGKMMGTYEKFDMVMDTSYGGQFIQKFSLPSMFTFNTIDGTPNEGNYYYFDNDTNEFELTLSHYCFRYGDSTGSICIPPAAGDRITESNLKFEVWTEDHPTYVESDNISVISIEYEPSPMTFDAAKDGPNCTIKLKIKEPAEEEQRYRITVSFDELFDRLDNQFPVDVSDGEELLENLSSAFINEQRLLDIRSSLPDGSTGKLKEYERRYRELAIEVIYEYIE